MPSRKFWVIALIGGLAPLWIASASFADDDAEKKAKDEKADTPAAASAAKPKDELMELYGVFVDAVEQVESNYYRKIDRRELLESALRGMLQDLDPHSTFISTSEWQQFQRQIQGSFIGIGIQVGYDADAKRLKVIAPVPGSPAYGAGVLAGDLILEIDGKSTEGLTPDKAVDALKGRAGTEVKLLVLHPGSEKTETLAMSRAQVEMPSVLGNARNLDDTWDFWIDPEKKIGYLRVTSFVGTTSDEVKKALEQLKGQGMKALVLDLRDNPGGLLSAAVEVSDLFLEDGFIVTTKGRNVRDKAYSAEKDGTFTGFPMAVLVNQHSASAAEIVSAALQDHKRAVVVGQRSYGKGSVQNILPLEDGNSVLKLTTQTYWRPSGKNIHRAKDAKDSDEWGVSPDDGLTVKLSDEDYEHWAVSRRDHDLSAHGKSHKPLVENPKPATPEPKKDEAPKADEVKKDEPKADEVKKGEPKKPVEDRQLTKALEYLRGKLAEASTTTARN